MRDEPHPEAGEQRDKRGQREPAEYWKTVDGNQQQPVKRCQPEGQSADVAEPETFAAGFAVRGGEHERGNNPSETGKTEFRKRQRQQQPRADGGKVAAVADEWFKIFFQRGVWFCVQ